MRLLEANANKTGETFDFPGNAGVFHVYGTFGGGTCKLQLSTDGAVWTDVSGASFTAAGATVFDPQGPCKVRAVLSGATSPSLNADLNTRG